MDRNRLHYDTTALKAARYICKCATLPCEGKNWVIVIFLLCKMMVHLHQKHNCNSFWSKVFSLERETQCRGVLLQGIPQSPTASVLRPCKTQAIHSQGQSILVIPGQPHFCPKRDYLMDPAFFGATCNWSKAFSELHHCLELFLAPAFHPYLPWQASDVHYIPGLRFLDVFTNKPLAHLISFRHLLLRGPKMMLLALDVFW